MARPFKVGDYVRIDYGQLRPYPHTGQDGVVTDISVSSNKLLQILRIRMTDGAGIRYVYWKYAKLTASQELIDSVD